MQDIDILRTKGGPLSELLYDRAVIMNRRGRMPNDLMAKIAGEQRKFSDYDFNAIKREFVRMALCGELLIEGTDTEIGELVLQPLFGVRSRHPARVKHLRLLGTVCERVFSAEEFGKAGGIATAFNQPEVGRICNLYDRVRESFREMVKPDADTVIGRAELKRTGGAGDEFRDAEIAREDVGDWLAERRGDPTIDDQREAAQGRAAAAKLSSELGQVFKEPESAAEKLAAAKKKHAEALALQELRAPASAAGNFDEVARLTIEAKQLLADEDTLRSEAESETQAARDAHEEHLVELRKRSREAAREEGKTTPLRVSIPESLEEKIRDAREEADRLAMEAHKARELEYEVITSVPKGKLTPELRRKGDAANALARKLEESMAKLRQDANKDEDALRLMPRKTGTTVPADAGQAVASVATTKASKVKKAKRVKEAPVAKADTKTDDAFVVPESVLARRASAAALKQKAECLRNVEAPKATVEKRYDDVPELYREADLCDVQAEHLVAEADVEEAEARASFERAHKRTEPEDTGAAGDEQPPTAQAASSTTSPATLRINGKGNGNEPMSGAEMKAMGNDLARQYCKAMRAGDTAKAEECMAGIQALAKLDSVGSKTT